MKLRTGEPWMPAPDYGRQLRGLTINLLVRDIESALVFARRVLRADVVYADPDIAVIKAYGSEWMLHADHTYQGHPLHHEIAAVTARGSGAELRLHGCDPDAATTAARSRSPGAARDWARWRTGVRIRAARWARARSRTAGCAVPGTAMTTTR